MIKALDARKGNIFMIDGQICKTLDVSFKGAARAQKLVHLSFKTIPEGKFIDRTYQPDDKLEGIEPHRKKVKFMYRDESSCNFMDMETFEQFTIGLDALGKRQGLLKEDDEIMVSFFNDKPLDVEFPPFMRLKVTQAPPAIKQVDMVYKRVKLENGMEIDVPQFIKEGAAIELETETMKYVDRVKEKE